MFKKLRAFSKRFNKLSPDEKQSVREMVNNETISDTTEKKQKSKKRRKKMAEEEVKKEEVEKTEEKEVDKVDTDKSAEKSTDVAKEEKTEETETDKKEEETEEETTDATKEEPTDPQVNDTPPSGNGIRVEDLVTKDMLAERLSALEAKFDAVVKENSDLKEQLSNKSDELKGMQDKYENKDFGGFQKQGILDKNKYANSSFDEYSKQFM